MAKELHVLILEDNPLDAELMERELNKTGLLFRARRVDTKDDFVKGLEDFGPDIIFADFKLPSFDGLTALGIAKVECPDIPVIIVTGALGEEMAVEVMKKGATDYILKDKLQRLAPALERALREAQERKELKLAEEKVSKLVEELKRSNAELEQFAYAASHDLQEPLRMVSNYVQLLEHRYKGKLDTDADDFIAFAADGAIRMQKMINYLLEYSRVTTRGKPFEPTDCKAVLDSTLANLKVSIDESNAQITHDAMQMVMADSSQIERVFQNLVVNAIKYRGDNPPRIHVGFEKKGNECLFSVKDNGIGFEMSQADRLFKMFQRLHGAKYPGTGMGLVICKKIIERHGGRIWAESEVGKGSTFFFTIPLTEGRFNETL